MDTKAADMTVSKSDQSCTKGALKIANAPKLLTATETVRTVTGMGQLRSALLRSTRMASPPRNTVGSASRRYLFLFGAGASAFCHGVGPEPPPLGNRLFAKLCSFDNFFESFDYELKRAFEENFENGMAIFQAQKWAELSKFLCLMSLYFLKFELVDNNINLYYKLIKIMKENKIPGEIILSTINYDLILDQAFVYEFPDLQWRKIRILKLHGAPNILSIPPGFSFRNNTFGQAVVANLASNVVRAVSPVEACVFCEDSVRDNSGIAPSIAAYAVGKRVDWGPGFIKEMQDIFVKKVLSADKIVLIGVELNEADTHIWEPVAASKAVVAVVNPSFDKYKAWGERHRRDVRHFCKFANDFVGSDANRFIDFMNS